MKKWTTLLLLIIGFNTTVLAQSDSVEDQFFEHIGAVFFNEKGIPVVAKNGGDYKAVALDPNDFEENTQLIRTGEGPGELKRLYGYGFNSKKNELCLFGFQLRLICSDLTGNITKDERIPWWEVSGSSTPFKFDIQNDELLMPLNSLLSVKDPAPVIKLAALSSMTDLEKVYYLSISLEELGLTYLESLSLANNIFIKPRVLRVSQDFTIAAIAGLPYFYVFRNGEFKSRVEIETDYKVQIEVSMKPEFPSPGVMIPANINNLEQVDKDHFLVSRGNIHQDIPLGMDLYRFEERDGKLVIEPVDQIRIRELPEEVSEPNVTFFDGKAFIITNYMYFAYQIYVQDLEIF